MCIGEKMVFLSQYLKKEAHVPDALVTSEQNMSPYILHTWKLFFFWWIWLTPTFNELPFIKQYSWMNIISHATQNMLAHMQMSNFMFRPSPKYCSTISLTAQQTHWGNCHCVKAGGSSGAVLRKSRPPATGFWGLCSLQTRTQLILLNTSDESMWPIIFNVCINSSISCSQEFWERLYCGQFDQTQYVD